MADAVLSTLTTSTGPFGGRSAGKPVSGHLGGGVGDGVADALGDGIGGVGPASGCDDEQALSARAPATTATSKGRRMPAV
jgi:hypothetical protein